MKRFKQLIEYDKYQEEAIITFNASRMVLEINSNTSYLYKNNALSCAGGHHLLSNEEENSPNNGAVLNLSTIIHNLMSSAA